MRGKIISGLAGILMVGCLAGSSDAALNQNVYNDLSQTLTKEEGKREWVYDDATGKRLYPGQISKGHRTIGVGFNLDRKDAAEKIKKLGLNYTAVKYGVESLNEKQIQTLFGEDINNAEKDARKYLGDKYFDKLSDKAKEVVVDMTFNMGYGTMSKFGEMRKALRNEDYARAAYCMEQSKWYHQVGSRGKPLLEKMRGAGK